MTSIVGRYLFREVLMAWCGVTGVLFVLLVTSQLAKVLGDAAANTLPREAVFRVMWLTSIQYLTILVPIGLLLAILLALGRLYRDSEMYALMACGVGPGRLYRPLLLLAAVLALGCGWLSLQTAPWALREVARIVAEARSGTDLGRLAAGRFFSIGRGDAVVYAERATEDGHLHNVFVERRDGARVEVVVAEEAWQNGTERPGVMLFTFRNGRRYEGEPGSPRFSIVEFARHGVPYSLPGREPSDLEPAMMASDLLFGSADKAANAELQWRLSSPLMALVLAVLAVPLSRSSPRQGRFAGMGAAILIYVTYANLLGAARVWVERGEIPAVPGLWWVHGLFAAVAAALLVTRFGVFSPRRLLRVLRSGA